MTRRTPDESAICCYCRWWRDTEGNGSGNCKANDWISWYDDLCKCFAMGRAPRKRKKKLSKARRKHFEKMNLEDNLPF